MLAALFFVSAQVIPSPDWYSGDTHLHIQFCTTNETDPYIDSYLDTVDIDAALDDVKAAFITNRGLDVGSVLIWANGNADISYTIPPATIYENRQAWDEVRPVIGMPITTPPGSIFAYGIETSGLSVAGMGHIIALGVDNTLPMNTETDLRSVDSCASPCLPPVHEEDLGNDGSGDYPADAMLFLDSMNDPSPTFGYAHQSWSRDLEWTGLGPQRDYLALPLSLNDSGGQPVAIRQTEIRSLSSGVLSYPPLNGSRLVMPGRPPLLAVDVLKGRVDFMEATRLNTTDDDALVWFGMWYKLLNASQRPSISGGSDYTCIGPVAGFYPRTYVRIEPPATALTYDKWVDGLREGRTSLALGPNIFLNLEMGDLSEYQIGDQIDLGSGTPSIKVTATLIVNQGTNVTQYDPCDMAGTPGCPMLDDVLEIVVNGEAVGPALNIPSTTFGGTHVLTFDLSIPESSWVAARLQSFRAHTAPLYALRDSRPIAVSRDAEYLAAHQDIVRWHALEGLNVTAIFQTYECCVETEMKIVADTLHGQRVFSSIRDYAYDDTPQGAVRLAQSTYGCKGPIPIGIRSYTSIQRDMFCFNAPPGAQGTLRVSKGFLSTPVSENGAMVYVDEDEEVLRMAVTADDAGFIANFLGGMPKAGFNKDLYYQYVWEDNCIDGMWCSTDVIKVPRFNQPGG